MNMLTLAEKMLEENDLYVLADCADNLPMADRFPALSVLASDNRCLVIRMQIERMLLLNGIYDQSTICI